MREEGAANERPEPRRADRDPRRAPSSCRPLPPRPPRPHLVKMPKRPQASLQISAPGRGGAERARLARGQGRRLGTPGGAGGLPTGCRPRRVEGGRTRTDSKPRSRPCACARASGPGAAPAGPRPLPRAPSLPSTHAGDTRPALFCALSVTSSGPPSCGPPSPPSLPPSGGDGGRSSSTGAPAAASSRGGSAGSGQAGAAVAPAPREAERRSREEGGGARARAGGGIGIYALHFSVVFSPPVVRTAPRRCHRWWCGARGV